MTLLEILCQELPKRGGWPEGADYCVQHAHDLGFCWVIFGKGIISRTSANAEGMWEMNYNFSHGVDFCANELASDHATAIVTREQYEATGWNGVGLPQIGVECEWQDKNTKQWQLVKVVYASKWVTVIREINEEKDDDLVEIAIENYGDDARLKFRPLRTEAERAIDEMVRLSGVSIGAAKILYVVGYRKG